MKPQQKKNAKERCASLETHSALGGKYTEKVKKNAGKGAESAHSSGKKNLR